MALDGDGASSKKHVLVLIDGILETTVEHKLHFHPIACLALFIMPYTAGQWLYSQCSKSVVACLWNARVEKNAHVIASNGKTAKTAAAVKPMNRMGHRMPLLWDIKDPTHCGISPRKISFRRIPLWVPCIAPVVHCLAAVLYNSHLVEN